jgi:hypothetical protein
VVATTHHFNLLHSTRPADGGADTSPLTATLTSEGPATSARRDHPDVFVTHSCCLSSRLVFFATAVRQHKRLYPLFQQAYEGFPAVISTTGLCGVDLLLSTPVPDRPARCDAGWIRAPFIG